jgi:hypothetical protein
MDLTYGINPHQSPEAMAAEYCAREDKLDADAAAETTATPKEEMDVNREAERFVQRGRLNPENGLEIPLTSKARTVIAKQCCPTPAYLKGYDQIRWDD